MKMRLGRGTNIFTGATCGSGPRTMDFKGTGTKANIEHNTGRVIEEAMEMEKRPGSVLAPNVCPPHDVRSEQK